MRKAAVLLQCTGASNLRDREQFRTAPTNAMPGILTGGKRKKLKSAEELAALAAEVAVGTVVRKAD